MLFRYQHTTFTVILMCRYVLIWHCRLAIVKVRYCCMSVERRNDIRTTFYGLPTTRTRIALKALRTKQTYNVHTQTLAHTVASADLSLAFLKRCSFAQPWHIYSRNFAIVRAFLCCFFFAFLLQLLLLRALQPLFTLNQAISQIWARCRHPCPRLCGKVRALWPPWVEHRLRFPVGIIVIIAALGRLRWISSSSGSSSDKGATRVLRVCVDSGGVWRSGRVWLSYRHTILDNQFSHSRFWSDSWMDYTKKITDNNSLCFFFTKERDAHRPKCFATVSDS